jgi:hypothetical protein
VNAVGGLLVALLFILCRPDFQNLCLQAHKAIREPLNEYIMPDPVPVQVSWSAGFKLQFIVLYKLTYVCCDLGTGQSVWIYSGVNYLVLRALSLHGTTVTTWKASNDLLFHLKSWSDNWYFSICFLQCTNFDASDKK